MSKKATRHQKEILENNRLNPDNWLVVKNPPGKLYIRHRKSNNIKILVV